MAGDIIHFNRALIALDCEALATRLAALSTLLTLQALLVDLSRYPVGYPIIDAFPFLHYLGNM